MLRGNVYLGEMMSDNAPTKGRPKRKITAEKFIDLIRHFRTPPAETGIYLRTGEDDIHEYAKMVFRIAGYSMSYREDAEKRISHLEQSLTKVRNGESNFAFETEERLLKSIEEAKSRIYDPSEEEMNKLHELVLKLDEDDWKRHLVTIRQRKNRRKNGNKKQIPISKDIFFKLSNFKENNELETWDDTFERLIEDHKTLQEMKKNKITR